MARRQKKSNSQLPLILIVFGSLLVIGALVYLGISGRQPVTSNANVPYPEMERITLAEAKAAHDQGTAVFLDVRDSDSYNARHVTGAVNIPLALLENRIQELDANQWIITYCT